VAEAATAAALPGEGLVEARRLHWREPASERTLHRDGRRWTLWTCGVVVAFGAPAAAVLALDLWLFPVALILAAHAVFICRLQAKRAVTSVVPLGAPGPAAQAGPPAERVALGLLGDLLGHRERELMQQSRLALRQGRLSA
jgi:hypothetical protein